eukprot:2525908-Rhodomonas_salina.2
MPRRFRYPPRQSLGTYQPPPGTVPYLPTGALGTDLCWRTGLGCAATPGTELVGCYLLRGTELVYAGTRYRPPPP